MQLNVKFYKITWYSIICVALPGILLLHLHIHLTTTHLSPNRCGHLPVLGFKQQVWFGVYQCICANRWTTIFAGFWLGIFATKKACTSLAIQFGVLFGWFKRNFSLKTPTVVEKFHPKSRKVEKFTFQEISARKNRKVEKSKNSKNSKSRKIRSRKVEKFTFQEISARKVEKIEKIEKSEKSKNRKIHIPIHSRRFLLEKSKKSKNSKSRKVENFLIFWFFAKCFAIFALCDYGREERLASSTTNQYRLISGFLLPRDISWVISPSQHGEEILNAGDHRHRQGAGGKKKLVGLT